MSQKTEQPEAGRRHLLDMDLPELEEVLEEWAWPKYRAGQIAQWVYKKLVDGWEGMTNLSKLDRLACQRVDRFRKRPTPTAAPDQGVIVSRIEVLPVAISRASIAGARQDPGVSFSAVSSCFPNT